MEVFVSFRVIVRRMSGRPSNTRVPYAATSSELGIGHSLYLVNQFASAGLSITRIVEGGTQALPELSAIWAVKAAD